METLLRWVVSCSQRPRRTQRFWRVELSWDHPTSLRRRVELWILYKQLKHLLNGLLSNRRATSAFSFNGADLHSCGIDWSWAGIILELLLELLTSTESSVLTDRYRLTSCKHRLISLKIGKLWTNWRQRLEQKSMYRMFKTKYNVEWLIRATKVNLSTYRMFKRKLRNLENSRILPVRTRPFTFDLILI